MADLKPIGLLIGGSRLARLNEADRLIIGALARLVGQMTFEDEDIGPITLSDLMTGSLPRQNAPMVGTRNGVNKVFTIPYGDKAVVATPGSTIGVKINGVEYLEGAGNDFTLSESGGGGTGFDTVTLLHIAPKSGDSITTTYYKTP